VTPEDILTHDPVALTQEQRQLYFEQGFLKVEGLLSAEWLDRLRALSDEFTELSRKETASSDAYDLAPEHSAEKPYVRRLRGPEARHPDFWEFARSSVFTDIAEDLVGPDVKFHHGKLNYKHPGGGEIVKWHQDIPAWPHTNFSPVTLGVYFFDVGLAEGPLACVPGSHKGEIYSEYNANRTWSGHLSEEDAARAGVSNAVDLPGPAGTIIAINCRTIHGSMGNKTNRIRPLLLFAYSSADAFTWTAHPAPTEKFGEIVRGKAARHVHMEPQAMEVPPDWAKSGYGSIFAAQRQETIAKAS
jgi:ectoine hydroxylase